MQGPGLCGATVVRSLFEFLHHPFNEPTFVGDWKVVRLPPQEPSVVHQQEGGFQDEHFLILRLKAKES